MTQSHIQGRTVQGPVQFPEGSKQGRSSSRDSWGEEALHVRLLAHRPGAAEGSGSPAPLFGLVGLLFSLHH